MFELNEQELEQVAGGRRLSTVAGAAGDASAWAGAVESTSTSTSVATKHFSMSTASNDSMAIGYGIDATSIASSSAKSH
jgi:hypothetical protein